MRHPQVLASQALDRVIARGNPRPATFQTPADCEMYVEWLSKNIQIQKPGPIIFPSSPSLDSYRLLGIQSGCKCQMGECFAFFSNGSERRTT